MAAGIIFSAEARARLVSMRKGGSTWDAIGLALGVSRSRAQEEAVLLGVGAPLRERRVTVAGGGVGVAWGPRDVRGMDGLPVWHPISRGVLADAGLPVPAVGEVW